MMAELERSKFFPWLLYDLSGSLLDRSHYHISMSIGYANRRVEIIIEFICGTTQVDAHKEKEEIVAAYVCQDTNRQRNPSRQTRVYRARAFDEILLYVVPYSTSETISLLKSSVAPGVLSYIRQPINLLNRTFLFIWKIE